MLFGYFVQKQAFFRSLFSPCYGFFQRYVRIQASARSLLSSWGTPNAE
jgi:hypothetical protein